MKGHRFYAIAALTALFVCALIAAGCGDDNDESTTTTSAGENAKQTVDAAVTSCTDEARRLGGAAGTALGGACAAVGTEAKQAIDAGGENIESRPSQRRRSPARARSTSSPPGRLQDALTQLCDAIASAE